MAQPLPYERDYDFTSFQARHATTPPPGNKLDAEFDQIAATIGAVLSRIAILQRDDLQLANSLVGYDQLKPELRNGFTTPTVWATGKTYAIGASIYVGPKVYAALVAHTSGVFAADLAAGKWHLLADFTIVAGAVQTAVDSAAAAVVSATEAAASAFTASTAAMNAQALLDTIDVNDVTTLAAISADITAAVANAADISTVAGVVSDIPAVAGIAADVTTVGGIAADVTAAAANMAAIIAAPDAAEAAAESAQAAADIAATLAGVVVGPAVAVDSRLVAFDGATGKLVKDSGVAVSSVVTLTGTQTLTGKTLTSPVVTGADPWAFQPIGVPVPLFGNIAGVAAPPTDQAYRYIKLTASDAYNTGILTSESVSGSAPLVVATAVVSLSGSPINGQTVQLINSERRFLRAGSAGTVENDQMQQITGTMFGITNNRAFAHATNNDATNLFTASGSDQNYADVGVTVGGKLNLTFNSANSPNARTGNETRAKNIGATYYMRIK